jgi:hypothetical protein
MKRLLSGCVDVVLCASLAMVACAQGNPRGTSKLTLNGTTVSVEYGRPSLHGRTAKELLARLGTGEVWRLGADKSTTFKTSGDLTFGGTKVAAGEYSLWAKKESEDKWSLIFNKQHGQWGTDHDSSQDAASVPLNVKTASKPAEQVTITLQKAGGGGEINIMWGDMKLTAGFTAG